MLSWPRWRWITVSGTPAWIRQPALVCLRSWGLGPFVRSLSLALVKAGMAARRWCGSSALARDRWVLRASPCRSK